MLVMENDAAVTVVCVLCGGPILPGQPYVKYEGDPVHSESGDCDPEEGWNPHMETE